MEETNNNNKRNGAGEVSPPPQTNTNTSTRNIAKTTNNILNGVIGDYLDASGNELAIPMELFHGDGEPLVLSDDLPLKLQHHILSKLHTNEENARMTTGTTSTLTSTFTSTKNQLSPPKPIRLCILLHGLVNDERTWTFPAPNEQGGGGDYGSFLQRDLENIIPLYLRYNTGLHVSTNGRKLCRIMESLLQTFEKQQTSPSIHQDGDQQQKQQMMILPEIIFLCHSMGGLVGRSATHYAVLHEQRWVQRLRTVIFLGTPHQGSYWERAGNVVSCALGAIPRPYMKLASKVANLRSQGIKDLRYGYVLDEDWMEQQDDPDVLLTNTKKPSKCFVDGVDYFVVTGTVTKNPNHPISQMFGDALVSQSSAEGRSDNVDHHLHYLVRSPESIREFPGVNHNSLQVNLEVYNQVKAWIAQQPSPEQQGPPPPLSPPTLVDGAVKTQEEERDVTMTNEEEGGDDNEDYMERTMKRSRMVMSHDENDETVEEMKDDDEGGGGGGSRNSSGDAERWDSSTPPGEKWAHCRGAVSLVQDAVDAGATAVEGVQTELTDEVYNLLGKIKPIAPAVQTVHAIHSGIVSGIYNIIRGVNYGAGEVIKYGIETIPADQSNGGGVSV